MQNIDSSTVRRMVNMAGLPFFSEELMTTWDSRLHSQAIRANTGKLFFVTSDQLDRRFSRLYTVWYFDGKLVVQASRKPDLASAVARMTELAQFDERAYRDDVWGFGLGRGA